MRPQDAALRDRLIAVGRVKSITAHSLNRAAFSTTVVTIVVDGEERRFVGR